MSGPCFECGAPYSKCGCEAQAEIARLQAEVDRLTKAHDEVSDRAMRSAMRLITDRNDALEEAGE